MRSLLKALNEYCQRRFLARTERRYAKEANARLLEL